MFRGILRNVQFYLLLSSGLLALLAFQHLNWYDQGIFPYAHTLIDKPSYGSPDESTRGMLYYGDDAKAIGIFKFKVGLFKFALPTFSHETEGWEREDQLRVPLPPSLKRKNSVFREGRNGLVSKESLRVSESFGDNFKQSSKASVAYAMVIPLHDQVTPSLRDRAAVLAASIRRAHLNSPYKPQLYAINFEHPSDSDIGKMYSCSGLCRKIMNELGYSIVDLSASNFDTAVTSSDTKRMNSLNDRSAHPQSMNDLLSHEIVVHISLDSFLLQSMDSVFDDLLAEENVDPSTSLLQKKASQQTTLFNINAKSNGASHSPSEGSSNVHEIYIFKMSSSVGAIPYLELIKCLASTQLTSINLQLSMTSDERMESNEIMPISVRPKIRSLFSPLLPRDDMKKNRFETNDHTCKIFNNNLVLDGCIDATGSHQDCSHEDIKKRAVIGSFFRRDSDDMSTCAQPWECKRDEHDRCINTRGNRSEYDDCEWLQREWFRLAKSL
ncbi:hypothetical protein ACHAW6_005552 [Cyclotella cf. meneghiniana]